MDLAGPFANALRSLAMLSSSFSTPPPPTNERQTSILISLHEEFSGSMGVDHPHVAQARASLILASRVQSSQCAYR